MRRIALTLAAALTAVALAGCGGEDDAAGGGEGEPLKVGTEGTYAPFTFHDPGTN